MTTLASTRPKARVVEIPRESILRWQTIAADLINHVSRQDRHHADNIAVIVQRMAAVLSVEPVLIDGADATPLALSEPLTWELQFRMTGLRLGGDHRSKLEALADAIAAAAGSAVAK